MTVSQKEGITAHATSWLIITTYSPRWFLDIKFKDYQAL